MCDGLGKKESNIFLFYSFFFYFYPLPTSCLGILPTSFLNIVLYIMSLW